MSDSCADLEVTRGCLFRQPRIRPPGTMLVGLQETCKGGLKHTVRVGGFLIYDYIREYCPYM